MNNVERIELTVGYLNSQGLSNNFLIRFWPKVSKTDYCWIWRGATSDNRYGTIQKGNGKQIKAHVAAWLISFGPIEEGKKVLHRCDNPRCVNPDHLFLGTQRDNMLDANNKVRSSFATRFKGKISKNDAEEIVRLYHECGVTQSAIGRAFGIHQSTVWSIVHFKTWV